MLITKELNIKIVYKNLEYFNKLGFNVKNGDYINIKIKDLSPDSHIKIKIKCDICGEEKDIAYREHLRQRQLHNFDTCKKCSQIKNKITNKERYGVSFTTQSEEVKNKIKKTKLKKYGDSAYNNIEKTRKTNLEKYKTEYSFLNHEVKEKIKKTNLKNYGSENVFQNTKIREKAQQTIIKKYGVKNVFQSEEIKNKIRNKNIEKLGVPYSTMSKKVTSKTLETNIKNGRWIKVEDRSEFYNYYLLVYRQTIKNKKQLLKNWNGLDYYTNEYILENFNLNSNDKNYPTIDHKISIRYGFDNKIPAEEISRIENLCITTRSNNSSKNKKIENDFIK